MNHLISVESSSGHSILNDELYLLVVRARDTFVRQSLLCDVDFVFTPCDFVSSVW
jgi:hypothetical protein